MLPSLAAIFFSSFVIALSGALMPGPLFTLTVSESSRRGAKAGPLMILGHGILELILVLALLAGLAPFFTHDSVFVVIALAGGGILFWMALAMLRSLPTLRLHFDAGPEKQRNLILAGIICSIANPYWLIWWATIGLGYIMHSVKFGPAGVASFFCGHILADLAWYSLISLGLARGKRFLSDKLYRGLIGSCASLLLLFACYFFYSGLQKLV
ncbi:MAG: LysE family transporter [Deltaproteobacteria bacterium]|nr:LysE family transporter [Deltaproteobacteria bacterium]